MATVKKAAPAKKKAAPKMKASFDLFVYYRRSSNRYYDDGKVYVFAENPSGGAAATINAKGEVEISTGQVDTSLAVKSYCSDFINLLGLGDLPKNQLIKWSINAAPVVVDKAALKAALLKAAEKV